MIIRKATAADLPSIDDAYDEHFTHEERHGAYTFFRRGLYPTVAIARRAIEGGTMYVAVDGGRVVGSVIVDGKAAPEYATVKWEHAVPDSQVAVVHLLTVRPSAAGRGIATALLERAAADARRAGKRVLRLDTAGRNTPARGLYEKNGFRVAATRAIKVGAGDVNPDHLFLEKALD